MHFTLQRIVQTDAATLGFLADAESQRVCVTLELPWRDNAHDISCIPPGEYVAFRRMSPKRGYELFQLRNVPGRSDIEMHIGNYPHNTDGCVLLGLRYGPTSDGPEILDSEKAFDAFMKLCEGVDTFTLTVVDPTSVAVTV